MFAYRLAVAILRSTRIARDCSVLPAYATWLWPIEWLALGAVRAVYGDSNMLHPVKSVTSAELRSNGGKYAVETRVAIRVRLTQHSE